MSRHLRLEQLFNQAIDAVPADRARLLQSLRRDDPALARQLEALLQQDGRDRNLRVEVDTTGLDGLAEALADDLGRHGPGSMIGRYRIVRELGGGGMGVVYLADDTALPRRVALKVIRPEQLPFPSARARFRQEMEAASRIDHPSICPLYEAGVADGTPFLAMRYVEGRSLDTWLAECRRAAAGSKARSTHVRNHLEILCDWFAALGEGLHAAHEAGVLHRDVKPANIIIGDDGKPVLVDFGLARAVARSGDSKLTATGALLGTPTYMAPEQIRSGDAESIGPCTDVYALGLALRECLTLAPAFSAADREALYREILLGDLPPPHRVVRSIPEALSLVIATATATRPEDRYATALEFATDLRNVRSFAPLIAKKPPVRVRLQRFVQRHPVASSTMAVFLLGLLASLFSLSEAVYAANKLRLLEALDLVRARPDDAVRMVAEIVPGRTDPELLARAQEIMHTLRHSTILDLGDCRVDYAFPSSDGKLLVAGGSNDAAVFRIADAQRIFTIDDTRSVNQRVPVALAGDVLFAGLTDGSIEERSLSDGTRKRILPRIPELQDGAPNWQPFFLKARDDALLAGSPGPVPGAPFVVNLRLIDLKSEGLRERRLEPGYSQRWRDAALLADGRILAGGAVFDRTGARLQILQEMKGYQMQEVDVAGDRAAFLYFDPFPLTPGRSPASGVFIYSLGSELELIEHLPFPLEVPRRRLNTMLWLRGGQELALGFADGRVERRDDNGSLLGMGRSHESSSVSSMAETRNGFLAISDRSGLIRILDSHDEEVLQLAGHDAGVRRLLLGRDGRLISAGWDGTVRIWSTDVLPSPQVSGVGAYPGLVDRGNGHVIVSGSDGVCRLLDERGVEIDRKEIPRGPSAVTFRAPSVALIAHLQSGRTWTWELGSGAFARAQDLEPLNYSGAPLCPLPDGRIVVHHASNLLRMFDPKEKKRALAPFWSLNIGATALAMSRAGRKIAFGTWDNTLRICDETGRVLSERGIETIALGLSFSADGARLAASGTDKCAYVLDTKTGDVQMRIEEHNGRVWSSAFSPSGRLVATAADDGKVRVFDVGSGARLHEFSAHARAALRIVFPLEDRVVSAGKDGYVRWWFLDPEDVHREIRRHLDRIGPERRRR